MTDTRKKPSRKARTWTIIVGAVTVFGIFMAALNDTFSLWDRLFPPKQTSAPTPIITSNNSLSDYFPLFVGSTRTYIVAGTTPTDGGGPEIKISSSYTERILMTESGTNESIHIYRVEQTGGEIYDLDCTGFGTRPTPAEKWYITDRSRVFVGCTRDEMGKIVSELMIQTHSKTQVPDSSNFFPILIFPLEAKNKWPAFQGYPVSDDPSYSWYAEEKLDYSVPAGKFSNCYRIALYMASGVKIRYFCNGVGSVAMEYHHFGMPVDFRVELSSYSPTGNP